MTNVPNNGPSVSDLSRRLQRVEDQNPNTDPVNKAKAISACANPGHR